MHSQAQMTDSSSYSKLPLDESTAGRDTRNCNGRKVIGNFWIWSLLGLGALFLPVFVESTWDKSQNYLIMGTPCQRFENRGKWNEDLTRWSSDDSAAPRADLARLRTFLQHPTQSHAAGGPNVMRRHNEEEEMQYERHWLFLGDSTMARLVANMPFDILHPNMGTGTIIKSATRCDLMEYFALPRASKWVLPNRTLEGPCYFGLENPFCQDCSGCDAGLRVFNASEGDIHATYEYVPIEFARDRELQTPSTDTSQKTLALYLSSLPYKHDLCVASAGIHDIILEDLGPSHFALNVNKYLSLIKPYCGRVLWLLPSASLDQSPQRNAELLRFGESIEQMCESLGEDVLLFRTWNMSLPVDLHVDNVHHRPAYYSALARLIVQP